MTFQFSLRRAFSTGVVVSLLGAFAVAGPPERDDKEPVASQSDSPDQNKAKEREKDAPKWQPGGFGSFLESMLSPVGPGPLTLVRSPLVQKELGLTAAQMTDLGRALKDNKKSYISLWMKNAYGDGYEVPEGQAVPASFEAVRRDARKDADRILTPDQSKRLWEIAFQTAGALALTWPEVQDALDMTPSQRQNVAIIGERYEAARGRINERRFELLEIGVNAMTKQEIEDARDKMRRALAGERAEGGITFFRQKTHDADWFKEKTADFDKIQEMKDKAREEAGGKMVRLLTRRQKNLLKKMCGEAFDGASELQRPGPHSLAAMPTPKTDDETK